MLDSALLNDAQGAPLLTGKLNDSRDWSEVNAFCHKAYMPLATRPLVKGSDPDATLRMLGIGRITLSRFCFGTPTRADEFDPASGNIIVVNTLRGSVRHPLQDGRSVDSTVGDSYVVDCSRTDYWNVADGHDLQFNLTIPHALMEETAQRWYGFVPDDKLWKRRLVFGQGHSAWLALLDYATRSLDARTDTITDPQVERHVEEMLCIELLRNWANGAELNLETGARAAAPRYVREAELLMTEQAGTAITVTRIAEQLGISTRSLLEGFRHFRGITPHDYLKAQRLDDLRKALRNAAPGETVASLARARGHVNLGALSRSYQQRFGETPARTLASRPLR